MGLPNIPSPLSEGILCCFLRNGVFLPLSIVKGIVRITLYIFGINLSSSDTSQYPPDLFEFPESFELLASPYDSTYIEEIKSHTPSLRFDSLCCYKEAEVECTVCLTQFEPDSKINHLCCGHIFHKACLDKWLNYWNTTCPLCRAPLMIGVEDVTPCF